MTNPTWGHKRKCYVPVIVKGGWSLGIAVEGEAGYYKTDFDTVATEEAARKWADSNNGTMGIIPETASEIVLSTFAAQNAEKER